METSTLLTLSFLVYIASSASTRFIISEYTTPISALIFPYPLDTCVNYEITYTAALFGKFTCNAGGDTVTLTSYGEDATCATADSSKTPTDYNPSEADYALHSFECAGDDNYVKIDSCNVLFTTGSTEPEVGADGEVVCCPNQAGGGDCVPQTQATGVCVHQPDEGNSIYTMISCDNVTSITNKYGAAGCAGADLIPGADGIFSRSDIDGCGFYMRAPILYDVYRRMLECVEVADIAAADDYCPFVSDNPTTSPTNIPTEATGVPTPSPVDETTEDATNDVSSYFVKNVFALVLVIVVYMK